MKSNRHGLTMQNLACGRLRNMTTTQKPSPTVSWSPVYVLAAQTCLCGMNILNLARAGFNFRVDQRMMFFIHQAEMLLFCFQPGLMLGTRPRASRGLLEINTSYRLKT